MSQLELLLGLYQTVRRSVAISELRLARQVAIVGQAVMYREMTPLEKTLGRTDSLTGPRAIGRSRYIGSMIEPPKHPRLILREQLASLFAQKRKTMGEKTGSAQAYVSKAIAAGRAALRRIKRSK